MRQAYNTRRASTHRRARRIIEQFRRKNERWKPEIGEKARVGRPEAQY
jgi:hypothetical protein